jgi:hypothetical protein
MISNFKPYKQFVQALMRTCSCVKVKMFIRLGFYFGKAKSIFVTHEFPFP